jgi:hypothetical protein
MTSITFTEATHLHARKILDLLLEPQTLLLHKAARGVLFKSHTLWADDMMGCTPQLLLHFFLSAPTKADINTIQLYKQDGSHCHAGIHDTDWANVTLLLEQKIDVVVSNAVATLEFLMPAVQRVSMG